MEIKEGYIPFMEYQTYYRIVNPNGKKTPLVILHGGPGSTHNSYEVFDHIAEEDDRPIITYDQLGCGNSYLNNHKELWRKETWVNELENLRQYLKLDTIHLMGHSWGGMLEIIYMCDYSPKGIKSLVLSSTLCSVTDWDKETHRLIKKLPLEEQEILEEAEKNNDFSSLEVKEAVKHYMETYVGGPWKKDLDPDCLTREKKFGDEAYITAWGPSEFRPTGTLVNYEYTMKLSNIKCPTLLCHGAYDESTIYQNKIMYENIIAPKKLITYQNSRHMSYYEEHELYVSNLLQFLNEND